MEAETRKDEDNYVMLNVVKEQEDQVQRENQKAPNTGKVQGAG